MKRLTYKDFSEIRNDQTRLIDVREADEYRAVHVKGAELWPLSRIQEGALPEEDQRDTYVICRSGARSAVAASIFERMGWRECTNIEGGTIAAQEMGADHVE
jgi:rhodanese-related sulfurtransferase